MRDIANDGEGFVFWPVDMQFQLFYRDPTLGGKEVKFLDAYFYHTAAGRPDEYIPQFLRPAKPCDTFWRAARLPPRC